MKTYANKPRANKTESVANAISQKQSGIHPIGFQMMPPSSQAFLQQKKHPLSHNSAKQRVPPIQMMNGNNHPHGDDTLDERKLSFKRYREIRARLDEDRRREAQERRRQENARLFEAHEYQYYYRTYTGRNALIAEIIDKKHNLPRADYGVDLIDGAIDKMASTELIFDLTPEELINTSNSFKTGVLNAYNITVKETSGKTDTQLGLRADYVTYT